MTPTMTHRGPDDEGYLEDGPLALGMRRLSIIDLEGGHQPIFNEDGSVGVVLNGEIYNFQELTTRLKELGHSFRTRSDSEVVAHAYEEWGADCVRHLEGMFAIAVYDRRGAKGKEQRGEGQEIRASRDGTPAELLRRGPRDARAPRLFLARDRLGIKTIYYYWGNSDCGFRIAHLKNRHHRDAENTETAERRGNSQFAIRNAGSPDGQPGWGASSQFLFASEVRTLLASGVVPRRLSRSALRSYLLFGSVSEPMTLVEGVLSLPPGHRMTIPLGAQTAEVWPEAYWNIAASARRNGAKGEEQSAKREVQHAKNDPESLPFAATRVRELLEESVRRHLIADVPVAVFLSSGIDSSALAALASREVSGVHTFTVAFPEAEFSEAAIARRTANQLGTTHEELILSGDEMLARLDEAVGALDQPSMDGINTYFVSWAARQAGLKVALSGLGGDEVFGGYATFRHTPRYQRIAAFGSRVPAPLRALMASAMSGAGATSARGDAARKLAALWDEPDSLPHAYYFTRALFNPPQVKELLSGPETNAKTGAETGRRDLLWWNWLAESVEHTRGLDHFSAVTCLEARSYLVSTLLRDTDAMSMAHSLEVRVPFLHHPLVEFVTQLPAEMKLRSGTPKALLVAALGDLLPPEVVYQAKRGFTLPWADWLRGPLKEKMERGLSEISPALAEAMNVDTAHAVWQSYLGGRTSWSRPWSLYVLNEWVKRNL